MRVLALKTTDDQIDTFVDTLNSRLKDISKDLKYEVQHGDAITTIIFSGSNLKPYYMYQVDYAKTQAQLPINDFSITRRGNNYIVKIKH